MRKERLLLINEIDSRAKDIVLKFAQGKQISKDVLSTIAELYSSAQVERDLKDEYFQTAYHTPVTGELELFIARILYHFSIANSLRWVVLLRKQELSTAPDIRLVRGSETISIIEIKAKGGWIQPFLSPDRYASDMKKHTNGKEYNPESTVKGQRNQISKYISTFNISKNDIYFFLPTLALVHRKKYKTELQGYYEYFSQTSELSPQNFILLSENKRLDLAYKPDLNDLQPTTNFERMLNELQNK